MVMSKLTVPKKTSYILHQDYRISIKAEKTIHNKFHSFCYLVKLLSCIKMVEQIKIGYYLNTNTYNKYLYFKTNTIKVPLSNGFTSTKSKLRHKSIDN